MLNDRSLQIRRAPGSSPEVRAAAKKRVLFGEMRPSSQPGTPAQDGDDTHTADVKMEGILLASGVVVPTHGPAGAGGAAARDVGNGRNKRKDRAQPSAAELNTGAAVSRDNISSSTSKRSGKRVRRTVDDDDDVVLLKSDDEAVSSSRGMDEKKAGAKIKVKPEH